MNFLCLTVNEYMFYLAAATLASGIGGVLKPFVVTRLPMVGVAIRDAGRQKKGIRGVATDEAPTGGAASSRFKRKRTNVTRPGMLLSQYDCLVLVSMPFHF